MRFFFCIFVALFDAFFGTTPVNKCMLQFSFASVNYGVISAQNRRDIEEFLCVREILHKSATKAATEVPCLNEP